MRVINWIKANPWLVVILVAGAFLRFYRLDFQSIWLDEILSMNDANPHKSWSAFYNDIMFWEFLPHLFFLILRIAFEIFGFTTLVGRAVAAIIGILGVYSVYLLGRELFHKKAGLIAAALMAVNIFHISHSQEIRPYGLLFLFSALSFYRLAKFVKLPTLKNAIYYGIFTGLILHAQFFGLITIFCQCVLLLYFLLTKPKNEQKNFLRLSVFGGITAIIVFLPAVEPFLRVSEISSFWLQRPGIDAFTVMFREFFGNSEWVLFIVQIVVIFYAINLFRNKSSQTDWHSNPLNFSFVILFVWLFLSLVIPLLRSHLSVPMVLIRYFINILPAIIIIIAIGVALIRNKMGQKIVIGCLIIFSLIDVFAVSKYYHTVQKTQFRELTDAIKQKNTDNAKVVVFWSWLFPHFFQDRPHIRFEQRLLEEHVQGIKDGTLSPEPFWYADANSRPFTLSDSLRSYLEEHFILKENLEYHDAWAKFYVPKEGFQMNLSNGVPLDILKPVHQNPDGSIFMFENSTLTSPPLGLTKGVYEIILRGKSLPEIPIDNEHAKLAVSLGKNEPQTITLTGEQKGTFYPLSFDVAQDNPTLKIRFLNDYGKGDQDRNVQIFSIVIRPKQN